MSCTCTCTHPRPPTPTPTHPSTHTHTHLGGLHEHKPCIQHALQLLHLTVQCLCHLLLFQLIPRTPRKMMNVVSMQGKNYDLEPELAPYTQTRSLSHATTIVATILHLQSPYIQPCYQHSDFVCGITKIEAIYTPPFYPNEAMHLLLGVG